MLRSNDDGRSWSYLLDAAGWLLAVAGALAEARVSSILSGFQPTRTRRRATALSCLGIVVSLGACLVLSTLDGDGLAVAVRSLAAALLIGGIGAGLGGGLSLAVTIGARYAADRLANLDEP